jgi:hypothetical protein
MMGKYFDAFHYPVNWETRRQYIRRRARLLI